MHSDSASARLVSRRSLLGGAAGLAASSALPTATAAEDDLTVVTRNLYVGVNLFRLLKAEDLDDVRAITGRLLEEARDHPYSARASALAREIESADADVVCVQEAALLRTREPSQFDGEHDPGAENVEVDLLDHLTSELASRGLDFEVAVETTTNDVEVPAVLDGGDRELDVRLTDRIAVLVREGIETANAESARFDATLEIDLHGAAFALRRGFGSVDVTVDDRAVTAATTHLESVSGSVRRKQAGELLAALPTDGPVVLAGDLNSGPDRQSGAYDLLRESFEDAHEALRPEADGATCCFDDDLRGSTDELSRRVDVVLYRGGLEAIDVGRVGVDRGSRVTAGDGDAAHVWTSDHAGVVASFVRSGPAGISSPTDPPGDSRTAEPATPTEEQVGTGPLGGLVAVGALALARWRNRE